MQLLRSLSIRRPSTAATLYCLTVTDAHVCIRRDYSIVIRCALPNHPLACEHLRSAAADRGHVSPPSCICHGGGSETGTGTCLAGETEVAFHVPTQLSAQGTRDGIF